MKDDNIIKINKTDVGNYTISTPDNIIKISEQGIITSFLTISPYPYDTISTCTFPKENPEPKELVPMICKRCGGRIKNMKCESCDTEYEWR